MIKFFLLQSQNLILLTNKFSASGNKKHLNRTLHIKHNFNCVVKPVSPSFYISLRGRITLSITANGLCALREDCQSQKYLIEIVMPAQ